MTKIVFMGTPDFAVPTLERLIDTGFVVGVVTQPDRPAGRGRSLRRPPVKETAVAADIPVYQPKSLRKEESARPIRDWDPDLIVVAAFGQILRPHLLDFPPLGCINVHASLLPRWRGAAPIQHAILSGDTHTGITLMKMDKGLDTGPMLVSSSLPIGPEETAATLHDRLAELGGDLLARHLTDIINGRITPIPQDDDKSTYAPMIDKEDGRLDWRQPADRLDRRLRAMSPWPGAFTFWEGTRLKIKKAGPVAVHTDAAPGTVIERTAHGDVVVVAGTGGLRLDRIQPAGKRAMATADFVRGRPDFIGTQLQIDSQDEG